MILWDVDGTLIRSAGVTQDVFDLAVEDALGRHPGEHGIRMSGKTDPLITMEILAFAGVPEEEARRRLPAVMTRLEAEVEAAARQLAEEGRVLPGVEAVVARLDREPEVLQSVLTGNTAANATVKLRAFGLDRWLDVEIGAFGSDNPERDALVPIALDRVRRRRGRSFEPSQVWVVGDTPRDLGCARAGGARCLLVATGTYGVEELEAAGPDRVMADLADTDSVCGLLLS